MSTINIDLAADTILNVMIGQQDENEVREVVFDFSGWYTTYGSGTISLAIQRPKDEWPYEGTLTVDSTNHKATWEISDTDTAYAGTGQIQLSYKVGDAKKKSVVYRFTCHKSLGALGSVVTPVQIQTFIDEVEEALQTMDGKLDDMEDEITDVKSDLTQVENDIRADFEQSEAYTDEVLGITFRKKTKTTTIVGAVSKAHILDGLNLESGVRYKINISIPSATTANIYIYLRDSNNNNLLSRKINSGDTSYSTDNYVPNADYSGAYICIDYNVSGTIVVTASLDRYAYDDNKIDILEEKTDALNVNDSGSNHTWEIGSLNTSTGQNSNSDTRIRSEYIEATKGSVIKLTGNVECLEVYEYSGSKVFLTHAGWVDNYYDVQNANTAFIRILIRKSKYNYTIDSTEVATQAARCRMVYKFKLSTTVFRFSNEDIENIQEDLKTLGVSAMPSYWETALATAKATIDGNSDSMGSHNIKFAFITDTHWKTNAKKSPSLISRLKKTVGLPLVVFGGDVIDTHDASAANARAEIETFYSQFVGIDVFSTLGNHDNNSDHNTSLATFLSDGALYDTMFRRIEPFGNTEHSVHYGYYDDVSQKVRYIQFDTGSAIYNDGNTNAIDTDLINANATFVGQKVAELDSDWTCIIFTHMYWWAVGAGETPNVISAINSAIKTKILDVSHDATIAAIIVGHMHRDYNGSISNTANTETVPIIATTTDNYSQNSYGGSTMTLGTNTEQAFDIYQIDLEEKEISITRVGAGSDRTFTY